MWQLTWSHVGDCVQQATWSSAWVLEIASDCSACEAVTCTPEGFSAAAALPAGRQAWTAGDMSRRGLR